MNTIETVPGVTVLLDETGEYPHLTITVPKGTKLPRKFVKQCHYTAGEHGAGIEFKVTQ